MSAPRRDVKVWFDETRHAFLRELCELRGETMGEFCERVVNAELDRVLHENSEVRAAAERAGIVRNPQESPGTAPRVKR